MLGLAIVPFPDLIVIGPVFTPAGTTAVTVVLLFTVNEAGTLLNVSAFIPSRLDPVIVTTVPCLPEPGEKPVIRDACLVTIGTGVGFVGRVGWVGAGGVTGRGAGAIIGAGFGATGAGGGACCGFRAWIG